MTAKPTDSTPSLGNSDIDSILRDLAAIRADMVADAAVPKELLEAVHANYRDSARNLLHYLALRRHDLRSLQLRLAALGLSSLGRAESYVLATLDAVLQALHRFAHRPWNPPSEEFGTIDFAKGRRLLTEHSEALLGPAAPSRAVRIMVTMPWSANRTPSEWKLQYRLYPDSIVNRGPNSLFASEVALGGLNGSCPSRNWICSSSPPAA